MSGTARGARGHAPTERNTTAIGAARLLPRAEERTIIGGTGQRIETTTNLLGTSGHPQTSETETIAVLITILKIGNVKTPRKSRREKKGGSKGKRKMPRGSSRRSLTKT
jgi:hypothetical protein